MPKLKHLNFSIFGAVIVSAVSFFIKIVPCTKTIDTTSSFSLCALPSIFQDLSETTAKYYTLSNNPLTGIVFQFVLAFLIIYILLSLSKKKSKKVVDLTKEHK